MAITPTGGDVLAVTKRVKTINQKIMKRQYAESILLLENLYRQTADNNAALSLGYCHLEVKNHNSAVAVFKEIITKKSNVSDATNWYLAHTYLRKKQQKIS